MESPRIDKSHKFPPFKMDRQSSFLKRWLHRITEKAQQNNIPENQKQKS